MKPTRWFTRTNPILSHLRIAIAGALLVAAVGMAFLAAKTSSPSSSANPLTSRAFYLAAKKGDPDSFKPGMSAETIARGPNESLGPDFSPDVEAYLQRAFPMSEVPMKLTIKAQNGWASLVNASAKASSSSAASSTAAPGAWKLIGPSKATYPGVLNALGDGAAYIASGRITALARTKTCTASNCKLYLGAAGGGIWRTSNPFSDTPTWEFVSNSFATNAIGSLLVDPNVASGNTLYAGTGEPNVSGDSEAGLGIYKSTNGGSTWTLLPGSAQFAARAVASLDITPNGTILAAIARAVRGISSVSGGGSSNPPGNTFIPVGLYRSTDAGATFSIIFTPPAGPGTPRGVNQVERDPDNGLGDAVFYISVLGNGVWRTINGNLAVPTFTQIKTPLNANSADRAQFALAPVGIPTSPSYVRMYVGNGSGSGVPDARFYSTQTTDVLIATEPNFIDQTTAQNIGYCTGQCWYDNVVASPVTVVSGVNASADVVYLGGSFSYSQLGGVSNGRAILLSTDGGNTWSDLTQDNRPAPQHHEFTHPDQHALAFNPSNPFQYWAGHDGGIIRSNGAFGDNSYQCDQRGLSPADNAFCKSLLSRVPQRLNSLNTGLSTLQFQSLSVANFRAQGGKTGGKSTLTLQGGTQDNGTFQYVGLTDLWPQIIYGDGGQSGFSSITEARRFNTFFFQFNDVNFRNGNPLFWAVATGPIVSSPEGSAFYPPVIADPHPANGGTIFEGSFHIWRTQDWAGSQAYLEANCPEFTTSAADPNCGDFVTLGGPVGADMPGDLGGTFYGADRLGGVVAAIERNPSNTGTLWAATSGARVFFSSNSNAAAASVVYERLDPSSTVDPFRFVSSIFPNPANTNHAFISYSGYNFSTPTEPGHVFSVLRTGPSTATWTDISYNLPDLPITDLVLDDVTGDLYAASDFGVVRLANGTTTWVVAGTGLPKVEVPGLTIVPSERRLYAATHGRSAWLLQLPGGDICPPNCK